MESGLVYKITKVKRLDGRPYNKHHNIVRMQKCVLQSAECGEMASFRLMDKNGEYSFVYNTSEVKKITANGRDRISFVTQNTEYELTLVEV